MTYTHEQIAALLAGRTQGEWRATVDFRENEFSIWAGSEWPGEPVVLGGLDLLRNPEHDAEFIAAAPDIVAQLLARVEALEAESELLRQSRDGLLALGVHAAPFIEPTNRQLSNLLEGIRAEQRDVDDD